MSSPSLGRHHLFANRASAYNRTSGHVECVSEGRIEAEPSKVLVRTIEGKISRSLVFRRRIWDGFKNHRGCQRLHKMHVSANLSLVCVVTIENSVQVSVRL